MLMKKRVSFLITYLWIALFGTLGIGMLLFGEKQEVASEEENRMLCGFPTLSASAWKDGSFASGLENWLSDRMFNRTDIVERTATWSAWFSVGEQDEDVALEQAVEAFGQEGVAPVEESTETGKPTNEASEQTPAPVTQEETEAHSVPNAGKVTEEATLWTQVDVTTRDTVYQFPTENLQNCVDVLNAYRDVLPEDGHVFFTQVPFPGIGRRITNGSCIGWGSDVESVLRKYVNDGISIVSTQEVLEEGLQNGEYLYFATDHHWTPRAACMVAQACLKEVGIAAADYDDYRYTKSVFYGNSVKNNPEYRNSGMHDIIEIPIPILPTKGYTVSALGERNSVFLYSERSSYSAFPGGTTGPYRKLATGANTGRKCLVISDSYGYCFVPYLVPYYDEVHTVDLRTEYFNLATAGYTVSEYLKAYEVDEVYFVLSTASSINAGYMKTFLWRYL